MSKRTSIRSTHIRNENVKTINVASGSIRAKNLHAESVSGQAEISSADSSNDFLIILDATDSTLKKIKPSNLGIGGGGGGDITEVVAGTGLSGGSNSGSATVNLDINSLTADSNAGNLADSIAIADNSDSNNPKKITLTQLKTLIDTNTVRTVGVDTDGNGSTDNTLESSENLVLKAGTNVTLAESSGVVTINSSGGGSVRAVGVDTDGNGSTDNTLESGETLVLKAGSNVTLAESAGVVTINSSDINTTYSAGDGLDLSSTTFSLDLKSSGGLSITSTELTLDVNSLATESGGGALADSIAISDATDNATKKITLTQLKALIDTNSFRSVGVDTDGNGSTDNTLESSENLVLKAGTNVTLAETSGVVTINSTAGGGGDITSVVAGSGLSGGATSGDATVNLDVNDLTAVTPEVNDAVAIADSDDSNNTKKITLNQIKTLFNTGTQSFDVVTIGGEAAGTISIDASPTLAGSLPASGTTITLNDGLGNDFSEVVLEFLNHDTSPGVVTTKPNSVPMNVKATSSTPLNSRIIFNVHPDHADDDTLSDNKWHTHWSTSGTEPVRIRLFDQDGNHLYFIPVQGDVSPSGNFEAHGASNVETNSFGRVRRDSVLDNGDGTKSSYYSVGIVNNMGDGGEKLMYNMAVAILDAINRGNINFQAVHIISDGGSSSSDLGALSNSNYLGNGIGSGLYAWMAVDALMVVSNDAESTGHPIGIKVHKPAGKTWSNLSAPPIKIFYDLHSTFDVSSSSEFSAPTNTDVFYTQRAVYGKEQESDSSLDNTEYAVVLARVINNLPIQITAIASSTSVSLSTNQGNATVSTSSSSNFGVTNFDGSGSVSIADGAVSVSTGTGSPAKIDLYCENNAHKVTVKAPVHSGFSGDVNFTLPNSNGAANQSLISDGSGNTSWSTRLANVVEDTTPQLGGNLDVNGNDIVSVSNADIDILPNGSGKINLDGNGSTSGVTVSDGLIEMRSGNSSPAKIELYCEVNNAHKVTLAAPPHAQYSGNVNFQLPPSNGTSGQFLKTDGSGNTTWDTPSGGGSVRTVSVDENGNGSVDETLDSGETLVLKAGTNVTLAEASGVVTINSTGGSGGISVSSPAQGNSIYYNGSSWLASPSPTLYYDIDASTGNYRFTGPGVNSSTNNPTLYLYRGFTYVFDNTGNSSHPIQIRTSDGGSAYTDGVSGSQTGVQVFTVPHHISDTSLVYQCTSHSSMVGNLTIV